MQRADDSFNIRRLLRSIELDRLDRSARESVWACAQCLQCAESCPRGARPDQAMLMLRRIAAGERKAPPHVAAAVANVARWGRPLPLAAAPLTAWAQDLSLPREGATVFLAGLYPYAPYLERLIGTAASLAPKRLALFGRLASLARPLAQGVLSLSLPRLGGVEIGPYERALKGAVLALRTLGVEVAYLGEQEPWCGIELHTYGYEDAFVEHARGVVADLARRGVREVITADVLTASCLAVLYREAGVDHDLRVRHLVEVIAERIGRAKGRWRAGERRTVVAFSDPCYLARRLRLVDEPRAILRKIERIDLKEPVDHGLRTRCVCGGGSEIAEPARVMRMAELRLEELIETGAERVVTSCPVCVVMLRGAAERKGFPGRIQDIGELLLESLPEAPRPGRVAPRPVGVTPRSVRVAPRPARPARVKPEPPR